MIDVSYASEDAARLAEACLRAGKAHEIPARLRAGQLPEVVERELRASSTTTPAATSVPSARHNALSLADEVERAAVERFEQQRHGIYRP